MANLSKIPNELLNDILGHLRYKKIDHFDPIATKDLQNARLVSRWVNAPRLCPLDALTCL